MLYCVSPELYKDSPNYSVVSEIILETIRRGYKFNDIWSDPNNYNFYEALKFLIQNEGANPNHVFVMTYFSCGSACTPLATAAFYGYKEAVKMLLDAGADINQKASQCPSAGIKTPLSWAIDQGKADIVELLIERGASLE